MRRAALAALLLVACDGSLTSPDMHAFKASCGEVYVDQAADAAAVVLHLEAGFERARSRTSDPRRLERAGCHGLSVAVNPWLVGAHGRTISVNRIEIAPGVERVMNHEAQHLIALWLGFPIGSPCQNWQDHGEHPNGGCNLDGEWAR